MLAKLRCGADLQHPSLIHDADAVGDHRGLGVVVRDQDRAGVSLHQDLAEVDSESFAQLPVERAERLVEKQQARARGERAGERDTLLLPT